METNELSCRNRHCHVPWNGQCEMGEPNYHQCSNFVQDKQQIMDATDEPSEDNFISSDNIEAVDTGSSIENSFAFPWHSHSLGLDDLRFLAARNQLHMAALFGSYNAGKTTFLATLYLLLMNGRRLKSKFFAGSLTVAGWESISASLKIPGKRFSLGQYPHFPPHTSSLNAMMPGLLHLAFKNENAVIKDYLFTDPPGEWFDRWAENENDPSVRGAKWMAQHSTSVAIFADSEALTGSQRGEERLKLSSLMLRLSNHMNKRRVALIWTKSDITVRKEIKEQLEAEFKEYFLGGETQIFNVAAIPKGDSNASRGQGVVEVSEWLLDSTFFNVEVDLSVANNANGFITYRG